MSGAPSGARAALAAYRGGRADEARAILAGLGQAAADDSLALQLMAILLPDERRSESLALYARAVRIAPGDAEAHFNLAVMLQRYDRLDEAVLHYQQALALAPAALSPLKALADLLYRRGRHAEGWDLMQRYLAAGGNPAGGELLLAKLALDTRRLDEAERWFQAAAAAAPDDANVTLEHALLSLLVEDWARGWRRYEARLTVHGHRKLGVYPHTAPRWEGEPIAGKSLLIHREQGLGDAMMFAAAVPGLLEEGARVHIAVQPALTRLFEISFPEARAWASLTDVLRPGPQPPQKYLEAIEDPIDYQAPIGSLGLLRFSDGPPARRPYLRADFADIAVWAARLQALAPRRAGETRAGLVLSARRPTFTKEGEINGARRSIPAPLAQILAEAGNTRWFALHDRETAAMLSDIPSLAFADLSPWLSDLADTAAAIANLDVVVSVDTAVAHLAAAMGKPVILMLWFAADWRWGHARADSAFYPHVAVVRQPRPGDWEPVLQTVVRTLS
jgi:Flp pilus assembly protein TadD